MAGAVEGQLREKGYQVFQISAASREGIQELSLCDAQSWCNKNVLPLLPMNALALCFVLKRSMIQDPLL
jgi:hypothetical protein